MLADATCEDKALRRPLDVLTRHLTFGLKERVVEESARSLWRALGSARGAPGQPGRHAGRGRGNRDQGDQCVYDFLYVASPEDFAAGREEFRAFVESVNGSVR